MTKGMTQKKNKTTWILFGIAILLIVILFVLFLWQKKKAPEDGTQDSAFSVVLNGIEFDVPEEFFCYPDENSDLLLYNNEDCSMLIRVAGESFADLYERKDRMLNQIKEAGYECLTDMTEAEVGEHRYLYFAMEYEGRTQYALYTEAGTDACFHVIIDASDRNEKAVLELADSIFGTARETDKENTTMYDLLLLQVEPTVWEYTAEAVIQDEQGNPLASYGIPEGFYADEDVRCYEAGLGYEQSYVCPELGKSVSEGKNTYVTVSLLPETIGAREMIERKTEFEDLSITGIRQTEINGYSVYYYGSSSTHVVEDEPETLYEFYAVLEFGDGMLYQVEAWGIGHEKAMEPETYEPFLSIQK